MAESTTLETLVLEIDSSAQKANEGITNLIHPLRNLAKAVGTVVPALREMNRELKQTARLKIPNVGRAISGGARKPKTPSIIPQTAEKFMPGTPYNLDPAFWNSMDPGSQKVFEKVYRYQYHQKQLAEQQRRQAELDERRRKFNEEMGIKPVTNESTKAIVEAGKESATTAKNVKQIGEAAEQSKTKMSGFGKTLHMVGRILKTMIIRQIIRSMIKSFSEAWNAAYEFSRNMGGSFADAVDKAHTMLTDVGVTLVQTFAPVFEAIIPVLKAVSDAISYMCSGIQNLLSLLGMTSDVTKAATSSIGKYTSQAGKGGKATKNMLASWDQLNVIQSKSSGGSGGGSSYKPGLLKNMVSAETSAIIQMLTGEGMLVLGLVLACTGHIGLGVAAMAIGVAGIVKTLSEDWGKLPKQIQNTLTGIMTIAGSAMLGIGLLVMGVNPALGIGLIAAGVANLGVAVALNWDGIVERLTNMMSQIGDFFVGTWNSIRDAIGSAWSAVKRWAKDTLGIDIEATWGSVKTFFKDLWGSAEDGTGIAGWASNAWKNVSTWWETNVTENFEKEGVWGGVKGFFKGVWDEVSTNASNAWTTVNQWMDSAIGTNFEKEWNKITPIFKAIFGSTEQPDTIAGMIHGAFQDASEWWNTNVTEKVEAEGAWGGVKGFFEGLWGNAEAGTGIAGMFSNLWGSISQLWGDIVGKVETAWTSVSTWFYDNVTRPISDFFINMVNRVIDGLNWIIDCLNEIGHIKFGGIDLGFLGKIDPIDTRIFNIPHVEYLAFGANGLYDVPRGDLFVANERGAELVGSMNGKTTVANQGQIIEGIQKGVRDANADQNELLRQQNDLLRQLLRKENKFELKPTAGWGDFIRRSTDIWDGMTGG